MYGVSEIDARTLADMLDGQADAIRLIDVRSPAEMAQGVVPGSEPMPLHLIPLNVDQLARETRTVVLYCRSGARSAQACMYLAQQGVKARLVNLRGGIMDWVRQGNQVVSPQSEAACG